jgi:hypothetical protein
VVNRNVPRVASITVLPVPLFDPGFTVAEFEDAVRLALRGLIQEKSAA